MNRKKKTMKKKMKALILKSKKKTMRKVMKKNIMSQWTNIKIAFVAQQCISLKNLINQRMLKLLIYIKD